MMDELKLLESVLLGIIQGLTEFFPVSSDGHLVLGQALLGYKNQNLAFDVLLHGGTLGALIVLFKKEVRELLSHTVKFFPKMFSSRGWKSPALQSEEFRWTLLIWLTTFVTGLVGLIGEKTFTDAFESLPITGAGFLVTSLTLGAACLWGKGKRRAVDMPYGFALVLGLAQASALFPGISRSGMTIATALLFGLSRREAGVFSFTVAIPIIFLAFIYELRHLIHQDLHQMGIMLLGVGVSFVVGLFAIRWLLSILQKASLWPFAIYTFVLSVWILFFL